MLISRTNRRTAARTTTLLQVLTLFAAGLMMSATAMAADSPATEAPMGIDAPRYATPLECPRFATPQFTSRPLKKAYPGLEYSMRPAIKGGEYPYTFTLAKAPPGMKIDASTGAITWVAPAADGVYDVTISAKDTGGRAASQSFKVTDGKAGFYFLSPDGDDSADGSMQKPWKTMMHAANPPADFTYPKGAVIILRGGEYKIQVPATPGKTDANTLKIDAHSPNYWLAYPGEKPVIDLGWSAQQWQAVHEAEKAAGKKESTTQYGHRIALAAGSDYLYMDGLEVKNACYYMFVMRDGRNTIDFRRMNLHDLWGDAYENPGFIFTFAGESKQDLKDWGVRPPCKYYEDFVIQDCWMHDRYYTSPLGGHGGAIILYTTHNAVIEDNVVDNIQRGDAIMDKEAGYGNTFRGNVMHGPFVIGSTFYNDEIEVCDNYIDGEFVVGVMPGWLRNIWVHNNTIRGTVSLVIPHIPDTFDPSSGNFAKATTADSAKVIRDFPKDKKLVYFYRNVLVAPADGVIVRMVDDANFAAHWRYVYWDQNIVDSKGKVRLLWGNPDRDFSFLKNAGFGDKGFVEDVKIDAAGRLPADSPHAGKYGRGSRTTLWETRAVSSQNVPSAQTTTNQPAQAAKQ